MLISQHAPQGFLPLRDGVLQRKAFPLDCGLFCGQADGLDLFSGPKPLVDQRPPVPKQWISARPLLKLVFWNVVHRVLLRVTRATIRP
jgi:hypothetical protein